ncbi:MAG: PorP/SprF family type IX secretion system membrane protein [Bacteroidales bacterium]|nr:PorP/SprF family type IX secretion system membrane protein [Bacteroidales bacterium]
MSRFVKILNLILCFTLSGYYVEAQDYESLSFYYNPVQANPALAGAEGQGKLRLVYRDYYPGKGLNIHSISCSYDSFLENIHGGYGVYLSENILGGLINDLRGGAAYSYHLRASREIFINAGFMASFIHRSMDAGKLILPDQIDPLLGPVLPGTEIIASQSRMVFDAGIGFLITYRDYHGGISVNHLFRPDISGRGPEEARLNRRYSLHAGSVFYPWANDWSLSPGIILNFQNNNATAATGLSLGYKDLSVNILPFFNPRTGLSFVQTGLHVETGRFELGYNYNFIPLGNDALQPFTLSNQVYIAISLNNVEKRDLIKAIKYPKM